MGHGAVAPVAGTPGPCTAEGEAANGTAYERAEEVVVAGVAGHGAVALEGGDGGVPDIIGNQWGNGRRDDRTSIRSGRSSSVLEDSLVDGIDDEIADMPRAPEALGTTATNAATVSPVGGGDAQRVELGSDTRTGPAVHGQVVIDAPYHVRGGEVFPHGRVVGYEAAETSIPRDRIAERDDAAGIAAFLGGAVHALGGTFEELAALVGGDDGVDIEVEGIVDVLVGGAESDADRLEHPPDAEELERVAAETIGADDPDLGEVAGAGITRKGAASRPVFERNSARDAIVLVMLEDGKTWFGRQTAGQSRALIADRMTVTLFIGGDAGVSGYAERWGWARRPPGRGLKREV